MASLASSGLQLADPVVSARGAQSCALSANGIKLVTTVGSRADPLTTPFGASSFGEDISNRKTIEFRLPPQWLAYFQSLDDWTVPYLAEHSERIFKKKMTVDQVRDCYKPCVNQRGNYPATLRCKMQVAGSVAVRCWNGLDQRMPVPEDFRMFELLPRVHISHLWQMSRDCGWVCQLQDIQCMDASLACPFMGE